MSWLRVDDNFAENEKVAELCDRSFRLHVTALCYCARNLTDGKLSPRSMRVLTAIIGGRLTRNINELVAVRLWQNLGAGHYEINDWLEFNDPAEMVKQKRADLAEKRREAGRKGAAKRWQTDGKADSTLPLANGNGPDPTRPYQSEIQNLGSDFIFLKLGEVMTDADALTVRRLAKVIAARMPSEHDVDEAVKAACKPGVKSPSAVVLGVLKRRAA